MQNAEDMKHKVTDDLDYFGNIRAMMDDERIQNVMEGCKYTYGLAESLDGYNGRSMKINN